MRKRFGLLHPLFFVRLLVLVYLSVRPRTWEVSVLFLSFVCCSGVIVDDRLEEILNQVFDLIGATVV